MQTTNYKGFTVTLSDEDTKKLDKARKGMIKHWRCIVYDKANRKQMGFDIFGGSMATMSPLKAFYAYLENACDYIDCLDVESVIKTFGYDDYAEAKRVYKGLEKAYFKFRKFGYTDDDIINDCNELREEWG